MNKNRAKHNCETCTIEDCLVANYCAPTWKTVINELKSVIRYSKSQQIFYQGNSVSGIYFICSGKVKIHKSGHDGKTRIVRLAKSGQILGHRGFGGEAIYPIGATAIEESWITFIDTELYFKALKENPEFIFQIMMFYASELQNSEAQSLYLAHMDSEARIAQALIGINKAYGIKENGKIYLGGNISRRELADMAGMSTGQTIRVLSKFKRNNILEIDGKKIHITNYDELVRTTMKG